MVYEYDLVMSCTASRMLHMQRSKQRLKRLGRKDSDD